MHSNKNKKLLIGILILALGIRFIGLNQSLWMDEAISATVAKGFTLKGIITSFIYSDTHPPLYYLILRIWSLLFGFSEISLRFPSLIFALLTVYLVYKVGSLWNGKTGLYAALLMALSPLHIYYSQEARMYSLTTFLVTLSSYFLIKKKWAYFSLSVLFLALSDYLPLVVLLPFGIYVLFISGQKRQDAKFLLSLIPLGVFFMFWYPVFQVQTSSTGSFLLKFPAWKSVLGSSSIKDLALVWVKFVIGRIGFDNNLLYFLIVTLPSTLYVYLLAREIRHFKEESILWLWLGLPIVVTFFISFWVPGFSYFRLLFTLPAFVLLVAMGIARTEHKVFFLGLLVFFNLVFSGIYLLDKNYWREDWKGLVPFVESRLKPGEVVMVSYFEPFTPYLWYAKDKDEIRTFAGYDLRKDSGLYTLDYLMDLTDPERKNYQKLVNLGFDQENIYNFRGVGQLRYWVKEK
jgi:mannosyltransferase